MGTSSRSAFALRALALLGGALLFACGPTPQTPDASALHRGDAPAGDGARHLLGAARYDITVSDSVAQVVLRDGTGAELGTVSLAGSSTGGVVAVYVGADGSSATWRSFLVDSGAGTYWMRQRFEAAGQALELDVLADDEHVVQRVELATAAPAKGDGGVGAVRGDGLGDTFVLFDGAEHAGLQGWLDGAPVGALLESHAARALLVLTTDPAFSDGLFNVQNPLPANGLVQAIHKTPACTSRQALIGTSVASCLACIGAVAALPGTAGFSAILAIVSCALCGSNVALAIYMEHQCSQSEAQAKTLEQCRSFCANAYGKAYAATVSPNEHSCYCKCDEKLCKGALTANLQYDQTLCSSSCLGEKCHGDVQTCGDGIIESLGGACTAEECDPGASPSGCPAGKSCVRCRCLKNPDVPDAGADDAGAGDAGADDAGADDGGVPTTCANVTCDPGYECKTCGQIACVPAGSTCCDQGGWCPAGTTCSPQCGCLLPSYACCMARPGAYITCPVGHCCPNGFCGSGPDCH